MQPTGTLVARKITKQHGPAAVLEGVSLTVPPRGRIGVVGPNGIGKSTLLRILAGLEAPDDGVVERLPPSLSVGYLPIRRRRSSPTWPAARGLPPRRRRWTHSPAV